MVLRERERERVNLSGSGREPNMNKKTRIYIYIYIEEDKICDKAWRAQEAHVHRPMFTGPKKVEPILCASP